jgi:hypothetical protein
MLPVLDTIYSTIASTKTLKYNGTVLFPVLAMPSLFPGMNPYLEHPDRWSTVHNRFIVAIADILTPLLLPRYQVDIEKRIYQVTDSNLQLIGRSDASIQSPRNPIGPNVPAGASVGASVATLQPVRVTLPVETEIREAYLEIKEAATGRVITTIEILSPTNKRGQGRQKYEEKRQRVLNSRTHLVEIDLLRSGDSLPMNNALSSDYHILISREAERPVADLYPFNLQDPMPIIPIPLQAADQEPTIDLKQIIEDIIVRSGYTHFIDYTIEPTPNLPKADQRWLDGLLRDEGLRH